MIKENYHVIGVMSGTSLDGVDLAAIEFHLKNQKWSYKITKSETVSYSPEWVIKLKEAVNYSEAELIQLNENYTIYTHSNSIVSAFLLKE